MARRKRKRTPRVVGLRTGPDWSCHGPLGLDAGDLSDLRASSKKIRASGLKIPKMNVTFWQSILCGGKSCMGICTTTGGRSYQIMMIKSDNWVETLVHEVAHAVSDGSVRTGFSAHNQVWAAIYGVLYQAVIER